MKKRPEGAKVSTIVCNHIGFFEIINLLLSPLFPSYLAKSDLADAPLVGSGIKGLQSIFVNRAGTEEEKNKIVESIMIRQREIEDEGKNYSPICIFPEGTTTNGDHLIGFKRGAFQAMRTVQPCFVKTDYFHIKPTWENPFLAPLLIL